MRLPLPLPLQDILKSPSLPSPYFVSIIHNHNFYVLCKYEKYIVHIQEQEYDYFNFSSTIDVMWFWFCLIILFSVFLFFSAYDYYDVDVCACHIIYTYTYYRKIPAKQWICKRETD